MTISKSQAARKLGISRRTIQRKVRSGELQEDGNHRINMESLAAILEADSIRRRRGPKLRLRPMPPAVRYDLNASGCFELVEMGIEAAPGPVDSKMLADIEAKLIQANAATLRSIAESAMLIHRQQANMARVGLTASPEDLANALRRLTPPRV